jgi:hypothetical protein
MTYFLSINNRTKRELKRPNDRDILAIRQETEAKEKAQGEEILAFAGAQKVCGPNVCGQVIHAGELDTTG